MPADAIDPTTRAPRPPPRRRRFRRIAGHLLIFIAVLAVVLIALRLALPSYLQSYVNRVIDQSPEYDGRIGEIELNLWRGAYAINDLKIVKTTNAVPVPFFEGRRVDFALDWPSLRHGQLRGRVRMESPKINFVAGATDEDTQTGADQPWLGILDDLFPFRIDRAEVVNGRIHFHAFHKDPPVNIYLSDLQASVTNLTNVEDKVEPMMAEVRAEGTAMGSGRFEFEMKLDPHSHRPTFSLATRLLHLDVQKLNTLTRAYGDFDFESGTFDFAAELAAKNGFVDGYAKPLFRNITVISHEDLKDTDPFQLLWEALVGIVGAVFQNQDRQQFGTLINIEGDLDNPQTSILEIVGNVLRNAFVRAYLPRIEGRVAPEVAATDDQEDLPELTVKPEGPSP